VRLQAIVDRRESDIHLLDLYLPKKEIFFGFSENDEYNNILIYRMSGGKI